MKLQAKDRQYRDRVRVKDIPLFSHTCLRPFNSDGNFPTKPLLISFGSDLVSLVKPSNIYFFLLVSGTLNTQIVPERAPEINNKLHVDTNHAILPSLHLPQHLTQWAMDFTKDLLIKERWL